VLLHSLEYKSYERSSFLVGKWTIEEVCIFPHKKRIGCCAVCERVCLRIARFFTNFAWLSVTFGGGLLVRGDAKVFLSIGFEHILRFGAHQRLRCCLRSHDRSCCLEIELLLGRGNLHTQPGGIQVRAMAPTKHCSCLFFIYHRYIPAICAVLLGWIQSRLGIDIKFWARIWMLLITFMPFLSLFPFCCVEQRWTQDAIFKRDSILYHGNNNVRVYELWGFSWAVRTHFLICKPHSLTLLSQNWHTH